MTNEEARALVERLKNYAEHPSSFTDISPTEADAAADLIDALLNEVERLNSPVVLSEWQKLVAERDALIAKVERLETHVEDAGRNVLKLVKERDALAEQINVLMAMQRGDAEMISALRAERDALARDAARYRHLRVQRWFHDEVISASDKGPRDPDNVDTEIDRDMQFEAMKGARDES